MRRIGEHETIIALTERFNELGAKNDQLEAEVERLRACVRSLRQDVLAVRHWNANKGGMRPTKPPELTNAGPAMLAYLERWLRNTGVDDK